MRNRLGIVGSIGHAGSAAAAAAGPAVGSTARARGVLDEGSESVGDILIVDDNPANLVGFEAALGDFAGRVVRAQSGADALRYLLDHDCALILLDVQMPSMDGFETAKLIRQRKRSHDTPIIFVTAYGREDADVLEAYKLGAVDFLFKPVSAEILRAKASVFVALRQRQAEIARQAELLRDHERRDHEQRLFDERRRWEEEALRRQRDEAQRAAVALERKAEELARSVAEKAAAERELKRINHELSEADRRKDVFLAMLGHELRNPLASIVTGLELQRRTLETLTLPDEKGMQRLVRTRDTIERQARHLARLVDDLLDISRINSGKIDLRKQPVRVGDIVEQAVAAVRPLADERKHALVVTARSADATMLADPVRLTQIVANLLNNAARYTPDGGRIELDCDVDETSGAGEVRFCVRDNGRGIAPEILPRIFEMFVQEQQGGGGLGLGLTLVERLTSLHGGRVAVRSDGLGKGAEFTVVLPLGVAAIEPAGPSRGEASDDGEPASDGERPLRVVLVEDNDDIRATLQELLGCYGHEVTVASEGEAGAALILERRPDVAFIDIGMPRLDGYGVASRVRAALPNARLRLVAMSGYGRPADRARSLEAGFDAHLTKPVAPEALLDILADVVRESANGATQAVVPPVQVLDTVPSTS
jgi:signal transduction histidine kinase